MTTFIHSADWQLGKPFARIADDEQRGRVQREQCWGLGRPAGNLQASSALQTSADQCHMTCRQFVCRSLVSLKSDYSPI